MIGAWVLENPGETATAATVVATGAGWLLVKWLGDKFEPKRPVKTDEQKRLDLEEKAHAVLSTQQIGVFADATITRVYHSAEFCENVERVVIRSNDEFRQVLDLKADASFGWAWPKVLRQRLRDARRWEADRAHGILMSDPCWEIWQKNAAVEPGAASLDSQGPGFHEV